MAGRRGKIAFHMSRHLAIDQLCGFYRQNTDLKQNQAFWALHLLKNYSTYNTSLLVINFLMISFCYLSQISNIGKSFSLKITGYFSRVSIRDDFSINIQSR